jgi:hypothetical protein
MKNIENTVWTIVTIVIVVGLMWLVSCTAKHDAITNTIEKNRPKVLVVCETPMLEPETYEVRVIEGCEYLMCRTTHGYNVPTHKGNCTNNIHIYNKE